MGTANYDFTYLEPNNAINIVQDTSTFLDEIDAAIKDNSFQMSYMGRDGQKIVVYSDSTFQTNPDPSSGTIQKSVVSFLGEMLPHSEIVNKGVGGTNTAYLVDTAIPSTTPEEAANVDLVVIAYGTNDWQAGREVESALSTQTNTFWYLYNKALDDAQEKFPDAVILCVTSGYIHSPVASDYLNLNAKGCAPIAYWSVVQEAADSHGMPCLRLDKILNINEGNYQTKMVVSYDGIWVHYSQSTNKKIAELICGGFYNAATPFNATSPNIADGNLILDACEPIIDTYNYQNKPHLVVSNAGNGFQFNAVKGQTYFIVGTPISFANCIIRVNDVAIAKSNASGLMCVPWTAESNGPVKVRFYAPDSTKRWVACPGVYTQIGHMSDLFYGYANRIVSDDITYELVGNRLNIRSDSATIPANIYLGDLVSFGVEGFAIGYYYDGSSFVPCTARLDSGGLLTFNNGGGTQVIQLRMGSFLRSQ